MSVILVFLCAGLLVMLVDGVAVVCCLDSDSPRAGVPAGLGFVGLLCAVACPWVAMLDGLGVVAWCLLAVGVVLGGMAVWWAWRLS